MNTKFDEFIKENHGKFKILAKIDGEFKVIDYAESDESAESLRKDAEEEHGEAIIESNSNIKRM